MISATRDRGWPHGCRCRQLTDEPGPDWSSFLVLNWTFLKGRLSVTLSSGEVQREPGSPRRA
jgi:hypothetical protein